MRQRIDRRGFTLLEMLTVVLILSLLISICVPKMAGALQKAQSGGLKGSLGSLRSALTIYYADNEGQYPSNLAALTDDARILAAIPVAKGLPEHGDSSAVANQSAA